MAAGRVDWAVGFEDETWWSRLARPSQHAWTGAEPVRLVEQALAKDDPEPKAMACYGVLIRPGTDAPETIWVRFVDGRPVSAITIAFLDWSCARLAAQGITTWVLVWDNAGWHLSKTVREWLRAHNRHVQRAGGVRIIPCFLPIKSPWLNPIEPTWVHGKRRVAEPARLLTAAELEERVCAAFACPACDHLAIPNEVA